MTTVFTPTLQDGFQVGFARTGVGVRREKQQTSEEERRALIVVNRSYYDGSQYDQDNQAERGRLQLKDDERLPEHRRLHAYSTQIAECLDFIANQLTDGFQLVAKKPREQVEAEQARVDQANEQVAQANRDARVLDPFARKVAEERPDPDPRDDDLQVLIDNAVQASEKLRNTDDEDIAVDDLIVEAGIAGDVPYETLWDPIEQTWYWEFWPPEQVEFDVPSGSWVRSVVRRQTIIVEELTAQGVVQEREVLEIVRWDLDYQPAPEPALTLTDDEPGDLAAPLDVPHRECRRRTWWDMENDENLRSVDWVGLPFIPWGVLRADRRGLRGFRGDPLITKNARDNADRYNANEQTAYLIARYNSHGNLGVVGDQAYLKMELDPIVNKDVADVLRFPGGTALTAITLPTDPTMIEHTKAVTSDAIYSSFGLTRVEPDTINGLGSPSGYALEIMNRKSEGSFRRVRRTFKADVLTMVNMGLDMYAYKQAAVDLDEQTRRFYEENPEQEVPATLVQDTAWWAVDPQTVFPNRDIEVRMGSGYIVDDVAVRDDFTAKLVSRQEALRQRGLSDDQIKQIEDELDSQSSTQLEGELLQAGLNVDGSPVVAAAGETVEQAEARTGRKAVPAGTQAGQKSTTTRS